MESEILRQSRLNIRTHYTDPVPLVRLEGIPLLTKGNISAIVGAPKSRKTFFATMLVGAFLNRSLYDFTSEVSGKVLWIDTEQSMGHSSKVYRRINMLRGQCEDADQPDLIFLNLRDFSATRRYELVKEAITTYSPSLVVIDGIADLLESNNDELKANEVQDYLLSATKQLNIHILSVIHSNFGSDKARGHTGSNLVRKCETIMTVIPDKGKDCSVVFFTTRDEQPDKLAFTIDNEGLPCIDDIPTRRAPKLEEVITCMNCSEQLTHGELVARIVDFREKAGSPCGESRAKAILGEMYQQGMIKCKNRRYMRVRGA